MAWIEVHQSLTNNHRKVVHLADMLHISEPAVIGHLVCFWTWAVDNAQDGTLPANARVIARAAQWVKSADTFLRALVDAGWIDQDGDIYSIHDWQEYAGKLIDRRKYDRERKRNSSGTPQDFHGNSTGIPGTRARGNPTLPNPTLPNLTKGLPPTPCQDAAPEGDLPPDTAGKEEEKKSGSGRRGTGKVTLRDGEVLFNGAAMPASDVPTEYLERLAQTAKNDTLRETVRAELSRRRAGARGCTPAGTGGGAGAPVRVSDALPAQFNATPPEERSVREMVVGMVGQRTDLNVEEIIAAVKALACVDREEDVPPFRRVALVSQTVMAARRQALESGPGSTGAGGQG